ncbi:hypothetical protein [Streptomyces orinoci]|uniref:Uncharacterized protein n=1 Tax=Streptomyces orinoci TaxID=67339 RepID=A0ABV3JVI2_STRON|nr:hypothetical protein [Streptomyces orinoci]
MAEREPENKRKKLSDNARFFLSGMPSRAEREKALREKTPEELDKAGEEVRSALAEGEEERG